MPIISNENNFFCENHFVFIEDRIILRENAVREDKQLTSGDLPSEDTLRRCLDSQIASDWFAEPELDYSAMMLERDTPVPAGCIDIPLREFFWRAKTPQEQDEGLPSLLGGRAARAHGFLRLRDEYRFCPKCGNRLVVHTSYIAKTCPACGRIDFPRIEPAIIVLVSRGSDVLLVKSKTAHSSAFYSGVAGFVEHGETLEECVAREVREETGISVRNIRYVGSQAWPFPDQLMVAFTAEYRSGDIQIQETEIEAAAWFPRNALPDVPKPGSVAYNLITGKFKN